MVGKQEGYKYPTLHEMLKPIKEPFDRKVLEIA